MLEDAGVVDEDDEEDGKGYQHYGAVGIKQFRQQHFIKTTSLRPRFNNLDNGISSELFGVSGLNNSDDGDSPGHGHVRTEQV